MGQSSRTLKRHLTLAAALLSLVVGGVIFVVQSNHYHQLTRNNAITLSGILSENVFNTMYQVMRQGWGRPRLEAFLASLRPSSEEELYAVELYRSERVGELFGHRQQGAADAMVRQAFATRQPVSAEQDQRLRYAYPVIARDECRQCHTNASPGEVLGVIEVRWNILPMLASAREQLLLSLGLLAPLPVLLAILLMLFINRRIKRSVAALERRIERVNSVSDLTLIKLKSIDLGFAEFNGVFQQVQRLVDRLRSVAVDKKLLEFNIRLTEKVVVTSEVVKDWNQYLLLLLQDIHQQIPLCSLFSVFRLDGQRCEVEVFWMHQPLGETRQLMEQAISERLRRHADFNDGVSLHYSHHQLSGPDSTILLSADDIALQIKSLQLDKPQLKGVMGMSSSVRERDDATRQLVMENILSTLLNMAGSVKAIGKYTCDLEYYATRDSLTGLFNQRMFRELLKYEIQRGRRHRYCFSLLVIDVDNFKSINDSYGHRFGDAFLQQLSRRMQQALRQGDILARYGGDEFVAILPQTDMQQARRICRRVLSELGGFALAAGKETRVKATLSIGGASYPEHAAECNDLFMFADKMMYQAKKAGKNRYCFPTSGEMVARFRDFSEQCQTVIKAIDEQRLIPYFQPLMLSHSGEYAAVEVLSRIRLGDDRLLGAGEFIPVAEEYGLIERLDYQVMEKAFAKAYAAGFQGLLFLNMSPRVLISSTFIPTVLALINRYMIRPAQVVFEITERDTVEGIETLQAFTGQLKEEGFKLAIDDFGSGFSSFHYLKHLPVDFVKIEGEFVANMHINAKDAAFVHSIAALAAQLGIPTVAEYVENEAVLSAVRAAGITLAQGFHIARPAPELPPNSRFAPVRACSWPKLAALAG